MSNTEIVAGNIMERAMAREDDFLAPATKFIAGLRKKGFRLFDVMAFLLTAAVEGHMAQPDFRGHGAEVADALDGLAIALQTGADAIRSAENFIAETGEAEASYPCDGVVYTKQPEGMPDDDWNATLEFVSKRFPRIAFVVKE